MREPLRRSGRVSRPGSRDIKTSKTHFLKVTKNHIVIDFDLRDQNGHKALERNLEAASVWPATYAELSQSGQGVHLHYTYAGDTELLATEYSEGIEVKLFRGDASLRRRLSRCNSVPIASISSGLPLKQKKEKMLKAKTITSEKGLRELIRTESAEGNSSWDQAFGGFHSQDSERCPRIRIEIQRLGSETSYHGLRKQQYSSGECLSEDCSDDEVPVCGGNRFGYECSDR